MIPLLLIVIALVSYFFGGINSPIFVSNLIFKEDIRRLGRRNASFENFVQVYGQAWSAVVVFMNVVKTVIPALLGLLLLKIPGDNYGPVGVLFAGFCVVLGDCYPWRYRFRGAHGVTVSLTVLTLADWRAGLVALALYFVVLAFTRISSLSGIVACFSGCLSCWAFVSSDNMKGLCGLIALFMALVVIFRQRKSFANILAGREQQIHFGRQADEKMRDDRF